MAILTPKKFNLSQINGGNRYESGDVPQPSLFNDMPEGVAYVTEQMEAITQPIDVSEIGGEGEPSLEWVDTTVNGRPYKKLKAKHLVGGRASNSTSVDVVQTTGESETAVMSQKATTDALEKKVDKPEDGVEFVKTTDYASPRKHGIVIPSAVNGTGANANGQLYLVEASGEELVAKKNHYKPVTPFNLDQAVKVGATTNTIALTDAEQKSACDWIGALYKNRFAVHYGIAVNPTGYPYVSSAYNTEIDNKISEYRPITPKVLDYAVKVGITTNTKVLTIEEQASACNWIGVDRQLALAMGKKTITVVASGDGVSSMPQVMMQNPTGYALINQIGATMHSFYGEMVEKVDLADTDLSGSVSVGVAVVSENQLYISGTMTAGQTMDIPLDKVIMPDNGANASLTITGSYTKFDDAAPDTSGMPPHVQFVLADGSVITNAMFFLYGESTFEVEIPSSRSITGIRLTCGTYDVNFTDCSFSFSVKQWENTRVAVPIKKVVLYKDMSIVLKRSIPAEIIALPYYGWGISETVYNYIDFDNKTYVQMCNADGALATPVTTDISAYLTDFDGTIEVEGADMISFETDEGMLNLPMPYKFMYHSKV